MDDYRYAIQYDIVGPLDFLMCFCGDNSNSVFQIFPGVLGDRSDEEEEGLEDGEKEHVV